MKKPDRALLSSAGNSGLGIALGLGVGMLLTGQFNPLLLVLALVVPAAITLVLGILFPRKTHRK